MTKSGDSERVVVAAQGCNGPDFYFCIVECTPEQFNNGDHYEAAKKSAVENGYEAPMVAFDTRDSPTGLFDLFVWESASIVPVLEEENMTEISKEQLLQEIIERLPKTADGVPFGLGSEVYCPADFDAVSGEELDEPIPICVRVTGISIPPGHEPIMQGADLKTGTCMQQLVAACYSTYEACAAAIQATKSDLVVVTWDWKEQPPWGRIEEACHRWVKAVICPAETNTDEHAVVIGPFGATPEQVEARMVQWRKAGK